MIRRILIVDDDEDDRDLFCEVVEKMDPSIECVHAKNGQEALHLLKSAKIRPPDLIFLDLNMPCINGQQCLRELKGSKELKHIPVIIYTSSKREADRVETKLLGAAHFITKPTQLAELYEELSFVLKKRFEEVSN